MNIRIFVKYSNTLNSKTMRLSLLLSILLLPILAKSQIWKAAEWTTSENKNVTGWVKVPTFLWSSTSDIKLKTEENGKAFSGSGLLALYLREGRKDTLVLTSFFDGHYHQLQQITNGKVPLFRELKEDGDDYFLYRNGAYEKWDRYNIKDDLTQILGVCEAHFNEKIFDYNEALVVELIRKLSRPKIDGVSAIHKWRYSFAYFNPFGFNNYASSIDFKNQFHVGIERYLRSAHPSFYVDAHLTYMPLHITDVFWFQTVRYNRNLKTDYLKIYGSFRLELLPKKNISPFSSVGYVLSIPTQYERTLKATNNNITLGGLPSNQVVKIKLTPEIGRFVRIGFRFNVSKKTRISTFLHIEVFDDLVDLSELELSIPLTPHNRSLKKTPDGYLLGLSISHSFYL